MALVKQPRMDTIPWIGMDKATIIIVTTSNANIFLLSKMLQVEATDAMIMYYSGF
jgi:hypothetical protein